MLKCDWKCSKSAHPYCIGEEKKDSLSTSQLESEGWDIRHYNYLISSCKVIPDKESIGLFWSGQGLGDTDFRSNTWSRGGYSTFKCELHKDIKLYCICDYEEVKENVEFMI